MIDSASLASDTCAVRRSGANVGAAPPLPESATMHRIVTILLALLLAAVPAAWAGPDQSDIAVSGELSYQDAKAFPPNAKLVVLLVDLAQLDSPRGVLTELTVDQPRPVKTRFELPYLMGYIDPNAQYAVMAKLVVGSEVWYATREPVRVLTQGFPPNRDIELARVRER